MRLHRNLIEFHMILYLCVVPGGRDSKKAVSDCLRSTCCKSSFGIFRTHVHQCLRTMHIWLFLVQEKDTNQCFYYSSSFYALTRSVALKKNVHHCQSRKILLFNIFLQFVKILQNNSFINVKFSLPYHYGTKEKTFQIKLLGSYYC